jgi:hypothetical protein
MKRLQTILEKMPTLSKPQKNFRRFAGHIDNVFAGDLTTQKYLYTVT